MFFFLNIINNKSIFELFFFLNRKLLLKPSKVQEYFFFFFFFFVRNHDSPQYNSMILFTLTISFHNSTLDLPKRARTNKDVFPYLYQWSESRIPLLIPME